MHKKISDFLAKNRPKQARSKLWPCREALLELKAGGASLRQMKQYLEEAEGIVISPKAISDFLAKLKKSMSPKVEPPPKVAVTDQKKKVAPEDHWMPKIAPGRGLNDF